MSPLRALSQGAGPAIHVMLGPNCGCCSAWVDTISAEGFAVTTQLADATELATYKAEHGISDALASCHRAQVEGYVIEGHVPVTAACSPSAPTPLALPCPACLWVRQAWARNPGARPTTGS